MINKKKLEQKYENEYNPRAVKAALYYAKKYGFDSGENSTYNNEADAFKHTFASALVSMEEGNFVSFAGGWYHELTNSSNNINEFHMDTHNNKIGRKIAEELVRDYAGRWDNLFQQQKDDIIADRVWKHMQAGDVILAPDGRRKLKNNKNTSYASDMDNFDAVDDNIFIPENRVFYSGEINPAKIGKNDDLYEYVPKYLEQYWEKDFKLPREEELIQKVKTGELIYVHDYVRSDGTKVSGYYRHQG